MGGTHHSDGEQQAGDEFLQVEPFDAVFTCVRKQLYRMSLVKHDTMAKHN